VTYIIQNNSDGVKTLYAYVKNSRDGVSDNASTYGFDNITLDRTAPTIASTPSLTGTVASTSTQDNTTYTTTLTVTLDNITDNVSTSWAFDSGSGITYYYVSSADNDSLVAGKNKVDNTSIWQTWDNLTLSLDNSSTWKAGSALNDNNSPGNKTIYIWVADAAYNISGPDNISIYFDNVSPAWSGSFFLRDNNTDNDTYDLVYFDNASQISIVDNYTSYASDTGSGIAGYYFTDNATKAASLKDNDSLWDTDWSTVKVSLDNTSDGSRTIYGYIVDNAGNVSDNASVDIVLDTNAPVIDNLTLAPSGFVWIGNVGPGGAYPSSANATLYLSAHDNDSTDNFSSGWKDFCVVYDVTRAGSSIIDNGSTSSSSCSWTSTGLVSSDNYSFDNLSIPLSFTSTATYFDNSTSNNSDNLTVVVWMRDNASNMSGNFTTVFSLDNRSIWYNP